MARIEEAKTRDDDASRERRSKKRKSPSDSDSISSDDNRNRKRERRRERKEKSHRKRRSSSSKKEKKKRRRGDDESSSGEEVKVKDKRSKHKHKNKKLEEHHSQKQGSAGGVAEVKALSEEDYFSKNNEFSKWLKEERGMFFSNLSSEKTHKLFLEFVNAWNSRQLRSEYYEGISSAPRTNHNWGLKIDNKTISEDPVEEREIAKKFEKSERKKYQKMQEENLDELLPKATGRDRMLEKRAINREQVRGRKESPELANEKDLMGGGDDFHVRLEKERTRKQKKVMEKAAVFEEKLQASRQKEAAAMSQLQAIINEAGGKITIPKRN